MLFIGCIDARLNIANDIGIPYGAALIYRNIAALVAGTHGDDDPTHVGEAAALEFAVNVMGVKDIVVMGHTDCGGISACLHGAPGMTHVMQYLAPLADVRTEVTAQGGDMMALARRMEQAAVRQSVANLATYRPVTEAVAAGRLSLHGWVINTATKRIFEMDHASGVFHLMR
jgi:carbonic anhydrase